MKPNTKKYLPFSLIFAIIFSMVFVVGSHTSTYAQSDDEAEAFARVDQAMEHLSDHIDQTISREVHYFEWSEQIFDNVAMGCEVEGVQYTPESTRGYQIRITVDEVIYDYRVRPDGSALILCVEGRPDSTSIGIDVPQDTIPSPQPTAEASTDDGVSDTSAEPTEGNANSLTPNTDWVWFYEAQTDTMRLFNRTGLAIEMPRPTLDNEALIDGNPQTNLAITRDGSRMLMTSKRNDNRWNMGIYDFASGSFINTHLSEVGEELFLFSSNTAHLSTPDSQNIAVSLVNFNFDNPDTAADWRIISFDMTTGNPTNELLSSDSNVVGARALAPLNATQPYQFPVIAFHDNDAIYFHLQPGGSEGDPTPPGFRWLLSTGTVQYWNFGTHTYDRSFSSGLLLFAYQDVNSTVFLAQGAYTSFNRIGTRDLLGGGTANVIVDGTVSLLSPRFANVDNLVIYNAYTGTDQWRVYNADTDTVVDLPADISSAIGSETGFFTIGTAGVGYHAEGTPDTRNIIYAENASLWQTIWAYPASDMPFALTN